MHFGGDERHRRDRHDHGDGRQLVGRRVGSAAKPAITSGVAGRISGPPMKDGSGWSLNLNRVDDAEIAAAAAQRPEQLGMVARVGDDDIALGGHHFGGEQRVDGEAVLAHHVADAAAQRQAADADGGGIAEADDEAVLLDRAGHFAGGEAGAAPGGARRRVDVDAVQAADVDNDAAFGDAEADDAVAAAAHRERQLGGAGEVEDGRDVRGIGDADHRGGAFVEIGVGHSATLVVKRAGRRDDLATQGRSQHRDLVFDREVFVHLFSR